MIQLLSIIGGAVVAIVIAAGIAFLVEKLGRRVSDSSSNNKD